jgi:K+:H+ antiporter subunit KhtT
MLMSEIREVRLPGVGVRLELTTRAGQEVAVVVHRGGRRELLVYDEHDPEIGRTVLQLTVDETRALGDMLGGSKVSEVTSAVVQDLHGLAIDWLSVAATSATAGRSIGDGMFRTRTGASIVAIVRSGVTIPGPGPDVLLEADDVAVAVGTPSGLEKLRQMLTG